MSLSVDRPKGPHADVLELEYCSAIRQTDLFKPLRSNGSLTATDIQLHLISRYAVRMPVERIEKDILLDLAGGQEYEIDLLQEEEDENDGGRGNGAAAPSATGSSSNKKVRKARFFPTRDAARSTLEEQASLEDPVYVTVKKTTPLDLVQQTALLLIPQLQRAYVEQKQLQQQRGGRSPTAKGNDFLESSIVDGPTTTGDLLVNSFNYRSANSDSMASVATSEEVIEFVHTNDDNDLKVATASDEVAKDRKRSTLGSNVIPSDDGSVYTDDMGSKVVNVPVEPAPEVLTASVLTEATYDHEVPGLRAEENVPRMIEPVLLLILQEAGLDYGVELTVDVIRTILKAFSEDDWSDEVVEEMLLQASGIVNQSNADGDNGYAGVSADSVAEIPVLDGTTFLRALTADTQVYDIEWENKASTIWQDASSNPEIDNQRKMGENEHGKRFSLSRSLSRHFSQIQREEGPPPLVRFYTADSIDFTADTYGSFTWTILLWFALVTTFFSYMFLEYSNHVPTTGCGTDDGDKSFGCIVADAIVAWLYIFLTLSVAGFAYLFLGTLGNSIYLNELNKGIGFASIMVSMVVIVFTSILAYRYGISLVVFSTEKTEDLHPLYLTVLVIGCILVFLQLVQLVRIILPTGRVPEFFDRLASSAISLEKQTKQACCFKVSRIVDNALECHGVSEERRLGNSVLTHHTTNYYRLAALKVHGRISKALSNYNALQNETESVGGVAFTFRNFWFGTSLAREEGIIIFPRLLWSNMGQAFIVLVLIYAWTYLANLVKEMSDPVMEGLSRKGLQGVLAIGALFGLAACCGVVCHYIPSAVSIFFRWRGGLIASLKDNRNFHPYRFATDNTTALFGATFWGTLVTGTVVWGFFSGLAFLFIDEDSRPAALQVLAQLIGVLTTLLLKIVILQFLRFSFNGAYYRRWPLAVNVMNVILECWHLGLSTAFIVMRSLKLFWLAVFYIGRVDTQFLAPGIGRLFGQVDCDSFPLAFRKDILAHEAHRHPYMERWALMYMLKLRYGPKFGTRAGAAWRILYTLALCPWMRKYRVYPPQSRSRFKDSTGLNSCDDFSLEKQALILEVEALREEKNRMGELEEEVVQLRRSVVRLQSFRLGAQLEI